MSATPVRIGVIGVGNMGSGHVNWLLEGKVKGAVCAAICDRDTDKLAKWPEADNKRPEADKKLKPSVAARIGLNRAPQ